MLLILSELLIAAILNIYCILTINKLEKDKTNLIIIILMVISFIKYPVRFVFYFIDRPLLLYYIKYLYLVAIPALTSLTYINLIILKKKILVLVDMICVFTIFGLFSLGLVLSVNGVEIKKIGYGIIYNTKWEIITSVMLCLFSVIIAYMTINFFIREDMIIKKLIYCIYFVGFLSVISQDLLYVLNDKLSLDFMMFDMIILFGASLTVNIRRTKFK